MVISMTHREIKWPDIISQIYDKLFSMIMANILHCPKYLQLKTINCIILNLAKYDIGQIKYFKRNSFSLKMNFRCGIVSLILVWNKFTIFVFQKTWAQSTRIKFA